MSTVPPWIGTMKCTGLAGVQPCADAPAAQSMKPKPAMTL
jgi:hypothetical protein